MTPASTPATATAGTAAPSPAYRFALRVYYEDTDASGVAYHANYLRWFERARTEWLRALDASQERMRLEWSIAFTVASLEIRYLRPARLDDALEVETVVSRLRGASLEFEQTLYRAGENRALATVQVRIGCVDAASFRPCPIPAALAAGMARRAGASDDEKGSTA
ncbi:MAG TPA: tol-pal system-associated acyl-CoA thioesterase [Solimonas sp.]